MHKTLLRRETLKAQAKGRIATLRLEASHHKQIKDMEARVAERDAVIVAREVTIAQRDDSLIRVRGALDAAQRERLETVGRLERELEMNTVALEDMQALYESEREKASL